MGCYCFFFCYKQNNQELDQKKKKSGKRKTKGGRKEKRKEPETRETKRGTFALSHIKFDNDVGALVANAVLLLFAKISSFSSRLLISVSSVSICFSSSLSCSFLLFNSSSASLFELPISLRALSLASSTYQLLVLLLHF
jgi:hypothetical protein